MFGKCRTLIKYVDELKLKIIKVADMDANNLAEVESGRSEAANFVMLAPGTGQGKKLYNAVNRYKKAILTMVVIVRREEL